MSRDTDRVARGARSVTLAVLLSRLLGLVREQVLAGLFGAGLQMDAYVVAYRLPNLLRDLLAEGAFASAFVTVFSHTREKEGLDRTWQLASRALSCLLLIVGLLVLLGEGLAPYLVRLLAPGFVSNPEKLSLATLLTRIMFPFLALVSLSAVFGGMLNTFGYFFVPAISSAFFNLVSVGVGVVLYFWLKAQGVTPIVGMACGVIAGGLAQVLIQWPLLRRIGFRFRFAPLFQDPGVREIFRLMGPMVLGFSAIQLNVFVNTYFASLCGEGAVSWLSYAFRVMYVPLGLFGVALSLALLPVAAAQAAQGAFGELRKTYVSSLLMGLSLALPSAVGLIILSEPIIRLLFERGRFTAFDTKQTALALSLFALSLPAYATTKVTTPIFYALKKPRVPMLSSFVSVGVNLLVVLSTLHSLGFRAVALATASGIITQALLQVSILYQILKGFPLRRLLSGFLRLLLSAAVMGLVAFWLNSHLSSLTTLKLLFALLGSILLCALTYFAISALLGPHEALYLFRSLKKSPARKD
ncbi:MAG: murein biosynthesis integral membrane protein MurJ [Thermodesulfobacteria bacterium]|nr:murein biosynthesis integral membrane protein MurJ [Thermodesulfobacteriota bacterium]